AIAAVANLYIPRLTATNTHQSWQLSTLWHHYRSTLQSLLQHPTARFFLLGASLFWGAGITLRFLLIDWVPLALNIHDHKTPTILNAIVAIGIIIGAALAAKSITLQTVTRCLPAGIMMGLMVSCLTLQHTLSFSYLLLIVIGILGGYFLIPLNAFLQQYGKQHMGTGSTVAVQNGSQNSAMLVLLALYAGCVALQVPIIYIGVGFGLLFACVISYLWIALRLKS